MAPAHAALGIHLGASLAKAGSGGRSAGSGAVFHAAGGDDDEAGRSGGVTTQAVTLARGGEALGMVITATSQETGWAVSRPLAPRPINERQPSWPLEPSLTPASLFGSGDRIRRII